MLIPIGRYKVYFYGTFETAILQPQCMWPFNYKTKEKFAPKNINKKAYVEGLHQIKNTPEIAALEGEKVVVRKVEQTVAEMQGTVENSTEIVWTCFFGPPFGYALPRYLAVTCWVGIFDFLQSVTCETL